VVLRKGRILTPQSKLFIGLLLSGSEETGESLGNGSGSLVGRSSTPANGL
jgi:hypothetical protein